MARLSGVFKGLKGFMDRIKGLQARDKINNRSPHINKYNFAVQKVIRKVNRDIEMVGGISKRVGTGYIFAKTDSAGNDKYTRYVYGTGLTGLPDTRISMRRP